MKLVILSGPSGVGKTVITEKLQNYEYINRVISYTTIPKRDSEVNGQHYHFVSNTEFTVLKSRMIETKYIFNNWYGSILEDISCIQLAPIEPIGMLNIRKKYPQLLAIFIKPPSIKILKHRLQARNDNTTCLKNRINNYKKMEKYMKYYDYIVTNNEINLTVNIINTILLNYFKLNIA